MPELPDVERFRRMLDVYAVGQRLTRVEVRDAGVLRGRSADEFVKLLRRRTCIGTERRGKWLLARLDASILLFHFGMTGSLVVEDRDVGRLDRVIFSFGAHKIAYRDLRKLRGIWIARSEEDVSSVIGNQGPDAWGLTPSGLDEILARHRAPLKSVLMNQTAIAGLGNMLSDEVLWCARVHPLRSYASLDDSDRLALSRCLQRTLRASLRAGEIPRRRAWLSSQRSRTNPRCPRCGAALATSKIAGRTSYWCPVCQQVPD